MKMGPTRCPETSVNNYQTTPCNYPKDHRLQQHRGGSLKSSSYNDRATPPLIPQKKKNVEVQNFVS
jgi:hypothetical protein